LVPAVVGGVVGVVEGVGVVGVGVAGGVDVDGVGVGVGGFVVVAGGDVTAPQGPPSTQTSGPLAPGTSP
jgi:hypothetical protein